MTDLCSGERHTPWQLWLSGHHFEESGRKAAICAERLTNGWLLAEAKRLVNDFFT